MKISNILRTPYTYFDVNDSLKTIVKTFNERHIASAPVVKEGVLIGIVSDASIASKFLPRKFLGLWTYNEPAPISRIKKMTADTVLEKKFRFLLPDNDILDVLPFFIKKNYDCIPVVESKESMKLIGIVRGADLIRIFLRYFATYESGAGPSTTERLQMETVVGRILSLVDEEESISSEEVSKELSITRETTERIGLELEKHGLIRIRYKIFSSPIFEKIERLG